MAIWTKEINNDTIDDIIIFIGCGWIKDVPSECHLQHPSNLTFSLIRPALNEGITHNPRLHKDHLLYDNMINYIQPSNLFYLAVELYCRNGQL